jgi:hypothetical protein
LILFSLPAIFFDMAILISAREALGARHSSGGRSKQAIVSSFDLTSQ